MKKFGVDNFLSTLCKSEPAEEEEEEEEEEKVKRSGRGRAKAKNFTIPKRIENSWRKDL